MKGKEGGSFRGSPRSGIGSRLAAGAVRAPAHWPGASASKAGFADALRRGNAGLVIGAEGLEVGGRGVELKPTRAFGDGEEK